MGAPSDWILITDAADADRTLGEVHVNTPLAVAMLGKRVGDLVTFQNAPHRKWTVAEICSKYRFAHRQTLAQFAERFPEDSSLEEHEFSEDANEFIETLKQRLLEGAPRWEKILEAYASTTVTVGAIGKALKKSPHESLGFVLASQHGLIAATNTVDEKMAASALLERAGAALVLDATALIMLDAVEVLEAATKDRTVIVAQTTIDVLQQEALQWRDVPEEGFMSLGVHEGQLQRHVFSQADAIRNRERLERLIAWLRDHCRVEPVSAAIFEKHADKHELRELIGESFADSIHLAAEESRILVSDDAKLRLIGRQLFGTEGVASAHLLHAQRAAGRIDPPTAATALMKLVVSNYRHVAVDATILEAAARNEQWRPLGRFERVVDTLKGPGAQFETAVIVAVEFFRIVWFALVLTPQRDALIMRVLDALAAGREPKKVLAITRRAVAAKFALLPFAAKDLEGVMDLWARMHLQ